MLEILLALGKTTVPGPTGAFALFSSTGAVSKGTTGYGFDTDVITPGTDMSVPRNYVGGMGNSTMGLLVGGYDPRGGVVDRYTYATNAVTPRQTLTTSRFGAGTAGNDAQGMVFCGAVPPGNANTSINEKIVYATDAHTYGTFAPSQRWGIAAAANQTLAIYAAGYDTSFITASVLYTFATDAQAGGSALGTGRHRLASAGNANVALFAGGYGPSAAVDILSYANGSRTAGTALGTARMGLAGASTNSLAVFGGGAEPDRAVTDKYVFSTNARTVGTALTSAAPNCGALSSTPGGQ